MTIAVSGQQQATLSTLQTKLGKKAVAKPQVLLPVVSKPDQPGHARDLKEKLSRFTKADDRKHVLLSLKEYPYLRSIPMEHVKYMDLPEREFQTLENEVCNSPIEVNGVNLGPGSVVSSFSEVKRILRGLCDSLTQGLDNMTTDELHRALIVRLADTSSKADTASHLAAHFGIKELFIQPCKLPAEIPCPKITVYESNSNIHATCDVVHVFGLYRKMDLSGVKPWIKLNVVIHERCNLSTGASVRTMEVRLPHK